MTVATATNKITYLGNGGTTSFPFTFAMPAVTSSAAAALLVVTVVDSTGASTVIAFGPSSTQYQLALNAPVSPNPTGVGGTITYNPSGTPIPTGSTLTIERVLPETQTTSLQNQGTLWQQVIEQSLDYLTMCVQQVQALFGNAIVAPQTDPAGLNYVLPAVAQRASLALTFDASGNVTVGQVPAGGIISAAMAPVVGAASLAVGRTAFGLGAMAVEGIGGALQDDGAGNARVIFATNSIAVNTGITSANYLQKIKATGPLTLTLPRANTFWDGFGFWVENLVGGGSLTIAIDSHDTIENGSSGTSLIIPKGASFFIVTNAAASGTWWIELTLGNRVSAPPPSSFAGLSIKVASNTTVTCAAVSAVVSDGVYTYTVVPSATINFANNGVNGLDSGAIAIDSDYFIWVIYNPITQATAWLASLQASPNGTFLSNLPSGYTAFARFGCVRTIHATATLYGTWQLGREVQYVVGLASTAFLPLLNRQNAANPSTTVVKGTVSVTAPAWAAITVTGSGNFVPTTASVIKLAAVTSGWKGGAGSGTIQVAPNANYGGYQNASGIVAPFDNGASLLNSVNQFELLLEAATIQMTASSVSQALVCTGWTDNI